MSSDPERQPRARNLHNFLPMDLHITAVPDAERWYLHDPYASTDTTITLKDSSAARIHANRLSEIYLRLGAGDHTLAAIKGAVDTHPSALRSTFDALEKLLPPEAFKRGITINEAAGVHIGNIAISMRRSTPEEIEAAKAERAAKGTVDAARRKAEVLASDADKVHFGEYDHGLLLARNTLYYLPLDSPEGILAARVLHTVQEMLRVDRGHNYISNRELRLKIWQDMPLAERRLFVNTEAQLFSGSSIINDPVDAVLGGLTGQLDITRRITGDATRIPSPFDFELVAAPPAEPYGDSVRLLSPPNAPTADILATMKKQLVERVTEQAEFALPYASLGKYGTVPQNVALELLDTVIPREGKLALRLLLEQSGSQQKLEEVLDTLRAIAKNSLGWNAYTSAYSNRTIAGNKSSTGQGHRAEQVGGRLRGDRTRTRWHISSSYDTNLP